MTTIQTRWDALRSRTTSEQMMVATVVATAALGTLAVWAWSRSRDTASDTPPRDDELCVDDD